MSTIDFKYRPNSYFWANKHGICLPGSIKGASRKLLLENIVTEGSLECAPEFLTKPELSEFERSYLGRLHPSFMGGEYLPGKARNEVEIARISIASTTQDVTCVFARQGTKRIYYRVVDEYGGDTLSAPSTRSSVKPLTLEDLTEFFLNSWNLLECLDFNYCEDGYPPDRVHGFITDASSDFYADFGLLIRQKVNEWLEQKRAGIKEDEE